MTELVAAAFIGSVLAALHHTKRGKIKMLRVFLTGFSLAVFTVNDVVNLVQHLISFQVSKGGILFFISFIGAELLERVILIIRTFDVNMKWNKKDDS